MYFDPFSDRTARDIRNSLSSALVDELTQEGKLSLSALADELLDRSLAEVYSNYIKTMCRIYGDVLEKVRTERIDQPRRQAIVLWNAGLYFELHELLETIWHGAREPDRTALKGLIQAAGAYVHSARGKADASYKLALKASAHIQQGAAALGFIANLDELNNGLLDIPPKPVRLIYREGA